MTQERHHKVDFCVVGGGLAGLCASIAAARNGIHVALIQDRPILGGNASSEIRMWVCGAQGVNNRETGLIEEFKLLNRAVNPLGVYSIWDAVLYGKAKNEPNLDLFLNASVCDATMDTGGSAGSGAGGTRRIRSVKAWQLTTYTWHTIEAELFADCSGDSILAPLSGAEFRVGRESRDEFGESIAPASEDRKTMGMSCLIQTRETGTQHRFTPPDWAYRYDDDGTLPDRDHSLKGDQNFWWLEVGGMRDSIRDTEELRDELVKISFGVWDHIKNRGDHQADNWVLDWAGFLPGKRESRRYVGDHILDQNDITGEGRHFDDIVAYGGWTMDDHFPEGFYKKEAGTIWHPAPSPYGIPFRSLYSKNIENLLFAGRNISATHTALASTRVMGTCSVIGQAVGTAAVVAVKHGTSPRGVYEKHIEELKNTLMHDDAYLPFTRRTPTDLTQEASISVIDDADVSDLPVLRNGYDRPIDGEKNGFRCSLGSTIQFKLASPKRVDSVRIVFDSDLSNVRDGQMPSYYALGPEQGSGARVTPIAKSMTRRFRIDLRDSDGGWAPHLEVADNVQRLNRVPVGFTVTGVSFTPIETWGDKESHLFAVDLC